MRLSEIIVRRFKGIRELKLIIPQTDKTRPGSADFLTILGRNNSGKSTILEALRLALPGGDLQKPSLDHFPERRQDLGPIEVELEFDDLTAADCQEQGIRTHVFNGRYRIKKVWQTEGSRPQVFAFERVPRFPGWPQNDSSWQAFEAAGDEWADVVAAFRRLHPEAARPNQSLKAELKSYIIQNAPGLVVYDDPTWVENPGGFSSHVDSVLPVLIFIPAIRETKAEAGVAEKSSSARQIVQAMFTRELAAQPALQKFKEAGDAVKELFAGGQGHEIVRAVESRISEKLRRLIPLEARLDFEPPDVSSDLVSKTTLELVDGAVATKPEHQGHGAQRALILSLLELLAEGQAAEVQDTQRTRPILLLIEEPEIYLHPQMCRKMRDVLVAIARSGTAQVICTSHSPIFIDLADRHDGIALLRKNGRDVTVFQRPDDLFGGKNADEARKRLRMLLDFDPTVNEVFFASSVCLVEGDSELAALDATARALAEAKIIDWNKYLLSRRELAVVNCRGKWTIVAFQRVLNGFAIPYRVVHDSDSTADKGANRAILEALSGDEGRRLIHDPNFEQAVFNQTWQADKPWRTVTSIAAGGKLPESLIRLFYFVLGRTPEELAVNGLEASVLAEAAVESQERGIGARAVSSN